MSRSAIITRPLFISSWVFKTLHCPLAFSDPPPPDPTKNHPLLKVSYQKVLFSYFFQKNNSFLNKVFCNIVYTHYVA